MQKIRIDFDNPGLPQHISAVENDSQSRFFQATLYENGKAYTAPEGAAYSIMYRGFGPQNQGWYDTINDGAGKRAACAVSGNVVTCEIARQALQVPGHVSIVLCVTTGKGYMLKSWPIECDCKNDRYDSTVEIQSFFYVTQISNASWTQAIQAFEELKNTIDPTLSLSGKAADAKATGDAVGQLKEDVANYLHINSDNIFDPSKVTKNKYINSSGEELDSLNYELSEFIPVPFDGDNYLYFNKDAVSTVYADYKGVHQVILYDADKKFIKRVTFIGAFFAAFNQANAKYMRLMIGINTGNLMVVVSDKYDATFSPTYIPYGGVYSENFKNEVNETLKEYASSEEFKNNINFVIDKRQENDTERPLEHIIHDGGLTRIFRTAGVVGDSLSSGCMEYKDSSGNALGYDRYEFSWIQQMRGICGFDKAENFSVGGLTSKTFWTTQSQKVKNLREDGANHKCQLYFIALGVNDIADTTMEVGTPNDISNESSTTFYGYYSRIIKLIQNQQPKARIFLVGLPNHDKMTIWGKRFTDFKNAIADMVNHFNFVYYLDLYQYESAYDSEFQKIYFNGFHENALGYARTAWVISSYVDWYIRHNYEEFREVGFIGTDYHYYE